MGTTDFPADLVERAYLAWDEAFVTGDPRRPYVALRDALGDGSFNWPWLKQSFEWIKREIAPTLGWPYLWRTPVRGDLRLPGSMLRLLSGELASMTYHGRDRSNAARLRQHRRPAGRVPKAILVSGWGCPVEDAIARRFIHRFAAGDGTAWPPFFPGDRTATRIEVFDREETSPMEISSCPLAAVEPLWPVPPNMPFPAF